MRRTRMLGIIVGLALAASCGGGDGPTASAGGSVGGKAVNVNDNAYAPATLTVAAGSTVTWTWKGANQHSVTFDDGPASSTQTTGTYSRAFNGAGTFNYHCVVHGTGMSGTIVVQ